MASDRNKEDDRIAERQKTSRENAHWRRKWATRPEAIEHEIGRTRDLTPPSRGNPLQEAISALDSYWPRMQIFPDCVGELQRQSKMPLDAHTKTVLMLRTLLTGLKAARAYRELELQDPANHRVTPWSTGRGDEINRAIHTIDVDLLLFSRRLHDLTGSFE